MYNEHFGLKRAPFRITPDTRLFYSGGSRGDILEALVYAVTSGEGIVKVVGEVGSGKTMLCRMLEERLPASVEVVYLANPSLSPEDTLHAIALEMNLPLDPGANRLKVMHVLQHHLLEKHAANRQVVVFVEEAQSMPIATLEEIRLLSNLETKRDKLLQIVLFGQPELDAKLDQVEIRQLKERITHSFYLQPFTPDQIREYVNFRLRAVGYRGPDMFRTGAYRLIARASAGLTRRVNILADKALLAAFADDSHEVAPRHVVIAIKDSQFAERPRGRLPEVSVALGLVIIIAAVAWGLVAGGASTPATISSLLGSDAASTSADPARAPGGEAPPASARGPDSVVSAPPAARTPPTSDIAAAESEPARASPDAPEATVAGAAAGGNAGDARRALGVATGDGRGRLLLSDSLSHAGAAPTDSRATTEPSVAAAASSDDAAPSAAAPAPRERQSVAASAAVSPTPAPTVRQDRPQGQSQAAAPVMPPAPRREQPDATAAPAAGAEARTSALSALDASVQEGAEALTSDDVGPLTKARLTATREWLQVADGGHFSIQLLLTDFTQRASLERFLHERQLEGELADYYVYETRIRSRVWYGVLYREYATFAAARAALEELPDAYRRHRPFIRNVRDIASMHQAPAAAARASDRGGTDEGATGT